MNNEIFNVNWEPIFDKVSSDLEEKFNISIEIDLQILEEINGAIKISLKGYSMSNPNIAKIAGHVVFWIRKLKPIHHSNNENVKHKLLIINELSTNRKVIRQYPPFSNANISKGLITQWADNRVCFYSVSIVI